VHRIDRIVSIGQYYVHHCRFGSC